MNGVPFAACHEPPSHTHTHTHSLSHNNGRKHSKIMIMIIPPVDLNNVLTDTSISIVTFSCVNDERVLRRPLALHSIVSCAFESAAIHILLVLSSVCYHKHENGFLQISFMVYLDG